MERKIFNPSEWLEQANPKAVQVNNSFEAPGSDTEEVEKIIHQIEANQIDIATAYSDWRDIGFAFADAFNESGRDYFHRVSRFYGDYSSTECDKQFDNCLKSKGQGITLKTFFFRAKQAGINIGKHFPIAEKFVEGLPTFPDSIFTQLPAFLQKVVKITSSNEERDILLLGTIVSLSASLHKLYGIYDGKKVFPNLYVFITAKASAGKGRLVHCKQLVKPIHKHLREQAKLLKQQHELEMMEYNEKKGKDSNAEKPNKPPEKMLFIPANNSTTGVFQLLSDNEGRGLMFETEGDTLAQAFKTDYGNYSDGFRKAFHHETISYYRRTDREYVDIESPCLSGVFSGTPKQVSTLIPNAENGLFSRFIFYFMNIQPIWKNVFEISSDNGLDDYFDHLGNEFFTLYQSLESNQEIQFCLSAEQQEQFNTFFREIQNTYLSLQGIDYMATVRRLGLIAFRMAMILSALRIMESGELSERIICEERDFQASLAMCKVLVKHASKVFSELPEDKPLPRRKNQKEKFLDGLPASFNRQSYLSIAASLNIPDKTAEGYITEFCKKGLLHREKQDHYINPNAKPPHPENQEVQETKEV
jgi:hypothetical protein